MEQSEAPSRIQRLLRHPLLNRLRSKIASKWVLLAGDLLLIIVSVMGSFALRLEWGDRFVELLPEAWRMVLLALLIKPIVYYAFGMYRRLWVYASVRELRTSLDANADSPLSLKTST